MTMHSGGVATIVSEKIAPGVILEDGAPHTLRDDKAIDAVRAKRDAARWSIGIGIGLMFIGSFSSSLTVGGALMVLGGFLSSFYFSRKLRQLEGDPWAPDPELDAWEEEQLED